MKKIENYLNLFIIKILFSIFLLFRNIIKINNIKHNYISYIYIYICYFHYINELNL